MKFKLPSRAQPIRFGKSLWFGKREDLLLERIAREARESNRTVAAQIKFNLAQYYKIKDRKQ